jgi:hypothetical protein
MREDPSFIPNQDFTRDFANIMAGIIWQMAQVVIPIYFMIRENTQMVIWCGIFLITSLWLKKFWWDRLAEADYEAQVAPVRETVKV